MEREQAALVEWALEAALTDNFGKCEPNGHPVILRHLEIACTLSDWREKVVALLSSLDKLTPREMHELPTDVRAALLVLQRIEGEDEERYLARVWAVPLAARVAQAQLLHRMGRRCPEAVATFG